MNSYGEDGQTEEEKMQVFEGLGLKSDIVLKVKTVSGDISVN